MNWIKNQLSSKSNTEGLFAFFLVSRVIPNHASRLDDKEILLDYNMHLSQLNRTKVSL